MQEYAKVYSSQTANSSHHTQPYSNYNYYLLFIINYTKPNKKLMDLLYKEI